MRGVYLRRRLNANIALHGKLVLYILLRLSQLSLITTVTTTWLVCGLLVWMATQNLAL